MGKAGSAIPSRLVTRGPGAAGRRISVLTGLALLGWLTPAFVLTAGVAAWDPVLLVSLAAIAMLSYFGAVALRTAVALDGAFIAALVAVVLLGPLPAACIWIATEIGAFIVQRVRIEAFLANVASFAAATLAAASVLALLVGGAPVDGSLGPDAYAAVALAGVAMLLQNFLVGAVLIDVLRDRRPLLPVVWAGLVRTAPATAIMIVIGTATVFMHAQIGVLALALFALVVVVPQLLLPRLLRPRPMHELYHTRAVALYAQSIGVRLDLSRDDQLALRDAAADMRERAVPAGAEAPLPERILAVADAWAGLTAKGSPELGHYQALHRLEARTSSQFDPRVVSAMRRVIEDEQLAFYERDAYQPSVRWPGVRRAGRRLGALLGDPLVS